MCSYLQLSMFTTQSKPLVQYIPFTCVHTWYVGRLVLTEPPAANTWQLVRQAKPVFCFSAVQVHMCFDIPRVSKLFCNEILKSKIFQSVDLFQRWGHSTLRVGVTAQETRSTCCISRWERRKSSRWVVGEVMGERGERVGGVIAATV